MVCHETYKDKNGNWLYPDEIEKIGKQKAVKKIDNSNVLIGASESMSKSKKYNRPRGYDKKIRSRRSKMVHFI